MDLEKLGRKLGLIAESVIRKAKELMRLVEIRSSSSAVSALCLTESCKAVICLELAAISCGQHADRDLCVRLGGTNKKSYASSMKVLQCLLDLQPKTTVADLCVQFSCTSAKTLANQVLQKYKETQSGRDCSDLDTVFFNSAALYVACQKLKLKIDKAKLIESSGAKRRTFGRLVDQLQPIVESLEDSKCQTKPLMSASESLFESHSFDSTETERYIPVCEEAIEPYEVWKQRILAEARQAIARTQPACPKSPRSKASSLIRLCDYFY